MTSTREPGAAGSGSRGSRNAWWRLPLRESFRLASLGGRGLLLAHLTLIVLLGVVPVASVWLMKLVVDAITEGIGAADRDAAVAELALWVGVAAALTLAAQLLRTASSMLGEIHGQRVADRVATTIHAHANRLDLADFEDPAFHDSVRRALTEGPTRPVLMVTSLAILLQAGITLAGMAGLLVMLHWAVPVVVTAAAIPAVLVRLRHARRLRDWQIGNTSEQRSGDYLSALLTSPQAAKDVRAFGLGATIATRYARVRDKLRGERLALTWARNRAELLTGLLSLSVVFGAYFWLGSEAIAGALTLGTVVLHTQAIQRTQAAVGEVLRSGARLVEDGMFLEQYFAFIRRAPEVIAQAPVQPVPERIDAVRFESVSFAYPGIEAAADGTPPPPVLQDLDVEIRRGERVAIIGANGAGKSTFVKLLARLYDPARGGRVVCVGPTGDVDLRHCDPDAWRDRLGVLFQDAVVFELSARDNIAWGALRAAEEGAAAAVERAAHRAGIDARLAALPQGYDTLLGRRFVGGAELSVGERRLVVLARVLARAEAMGSQLLILDEPSSSLDPRNEVKIFERLVADLGPDDTLVFVTHRPATLAFADRVLVFEDGRIVRDCAPAEIG